MKKLLVILLTGVLCFDLTGCNTDGKSQESKSDYSVTDSLAEYKEMKEKEKKEKEDEESAEFFENEETVEDEVDEYEADEYDDFEYQSYGNPLTEYEMTFNGQTLKLPMWYSDMVEAGWTLEGDDSIELDAKSSKGRLKFVNEDGNKLYASITNFSINAAPYSECIITNLEYQAFAGMGNSEKDMVELPEGIMVNESTYNDLINAYGKPSKETKIEEGDEFYSVYYEFDYDHKVRFSMHADTNVIYWVEIECEEELMGVDNDVSNERPDILDKYKAPKRLSDDPYDATFMLDKVVYQLPCPTEVFLENGWEITEGAYEAVMPGHISFGKIKKDGYELDVIFKSPVEYSVYPENAYIIKIKQTMYDGMKSPFSLYGGISMGKQMTVSEVTSCFEGMDIDTELEYIDMGLEMIFVDPVEDSKSNASYYITITDGFVSDIEIENDISFE